MIPKSLQIMGAAKRAIAKNFRGRWYVFKNFSDNTSIHGLKYITQNEANCCERLGWTAVFLAGVAFSLYFCLQMWNKYEDSPVLISLDSTRYLHKNSSFPAVTICNVNKVSKNRLSEVLMEERYRNIPYSTMQRTLRYINKLDLVESAKNDLEDLSQYFKTLNISATELFTILNKTAPTCEELILDCTWEGIPGKCDDYIDRLPSDDGLCCTFNGAFYNDTELGLQSKYDRLLQVNGNGYRMGVTMALNADVSSYSVTNGNFYGFKVLIHSTEKFPDVGDRGFVVNPGTETFTGIRGVSSVIGDDVAIKVTQDKRRCVADNEIQLRHFLKYSQSACVTECATRLMQELCHCRPFFLRAEPQTPICELHQYPCISVVYEDVRRNGVEKCVCLPQCTDEWFEPEVTSAMFPGYGFNLTRTFTRINSRLNLTASTNDVNHFLKSNVAILHVFFKERSGFRYKSDIRFGIEDFISAMGGLLGLGLGMSFISFIELLNFLCVRLFFKKSNISKKADIETVTIKKSHLSNVQAACNVTRRHSASTATIPTTNSIISLSETIPYDDL